MPREYVKGDGNPQPEGCLKMAANVSWNRDGSVLIATDQEYRFTDNEEKYTIEWMKLDRKSVNNLIRLLRKARDGAYGRDE